MNEKTLKKEFGELLGRHGINQALMLYVDGGRAGVLATVDPGPLPGLLKPQVLDWFGDEFRKSLREFLAMN